MDEDLGSCLRGQALDPDVHKHHRQAILNARPIPASGWQRAAKPPIGVTAWIVWERDVLQISWIRLDAEPVDRSIVITCEFIHPAGNWSST